MNGEIGETRGEDLSGNEGWKATHREREGGGINNTKDGCKHNRKTLLYVMHACLYVYI